MEEERGIRTGMIIATDISIRQENNCVFVSLRLGVSLLFYNHASTVLS